MKDHEGYTYLKKFHYKKELNNILQNCCVYMNSLNEDLSVKTDQQVREIFQGPELGELVPEHLKGEELPEIAGLITTLLEVPEVKNLIKQKREEEKSTAHFTIKVGTRFLLQQVADDIEEGRGGGAAERFAAQPFLEEDAFYLEVAARAQRALNLVDALPLRKAQEKILEIFLERGGTISYS